MSEWKESVERCFFTNHLDKRLIEFLNSQKEFSSDEERWEFLFKNAYAWEHKCWVDFNKVVMPSFFQYGYIYAYWGKFSFPKFNSYTLEETMYWIFLTEYVLIMEYGRPERKSDFPCGNIAMRFQEHFRYPKAACSWLDKRQFLKEIKRIYSRAKEIIPYYYPECPEWVGAIESDCAKFLDYYTVCDKNLKNPEIVRLNEFAPDKFVRYLIREESTLYFLQLCDFG